MGNSERRQDITKHKLRVGGGILIGLSGFLAIGLIGNPFFRYFLGLAIVLGGGIALGLNVVRRWRQG